MSLSHNDKINEPIISLEEIKKFYNCLLKIEHDTNHAPKSMIKILLHKTHPKLRKPKMPPLATVVVHFIFFCFFRY